MTTSNQTLHLTSVKQVEPLSFDSIPKSYRQTRIECRHCGTVDGVVSQWFTWSNRGPRQTIETKKLALCGGCRDLLFMANNPAHSVFTAWAVTMLLQPLARGDLDLGGEA